MIIPKYQLELANHERCIKVSIEALNFDSENILDFRFACLKEFGELKLDGVLIQLKSTVIKGLNADEWLLINFPQEAFHHLNSGWALAIASSDAMDKIVHHPIRQLKRI